MRIKVCWSHHNIDSDFKLILLHGKRLVGCYCSEHKYVKSISIKYINFFKENNIKSHFVRVDLILCSLIFFLRSTREITMIIIPVSKIQHYFELCLKLLVFNYSFNSSSFVEH